MSSFTEKLIISIVHSDLPWYKRIFTRQKYQLEEDFSYHVGSYPSDDVITAPKGYITDFASTPWFSWFIVPPIGKYGKASVIHDVMCDERGRHSTKVHYIFFEGMCVLGVAKWRRDLMYWSVRKFGPEF